MIEGRSENLLSENEKERELKRRNGAGSAELPSNSGTVKKLIPIGDRLLAVGESSTYLVLPPEQVDPEVTYANVPWVMAEEFRFGASSPVIARTLVQFQHFLSRVAHDKGCTTRIALSLEQSVRYLCDCQSVIDAYAAELEAVKSAVQSGLSKGGSAIHLPKVRNYEYSARNFFYAAKLAFGNAMKMFSQIPEYGSKAQGTVDRIVSVLERDKSMPSDYTEMIRSFAQSAWLIAEIRNAIEHPKENYYVTFQNVKYLPNSTLMAPVWTLKHPKTSEFSEWNDFLAHGNAIIENIIKFIEYSVICLLRKCAHDASTLQIIEISDYQKNDPQIRFTCNLIPPSWAKDAIDKHFGLREQEQA